MIEVMLLHIYVTIVMVHYLFKSPTMEKHDKKGADYFKKVQFHHPLHRARVTGFVHCLHIWLLLSLISLAHH